MVDDLVKKGKTRAEAEKQVNEDLKQEQQFLSNNKVY